MGTEINKHVAFNKNKNDKFFYLLRTRLFKNTAKSVRKTGRSLAVPNSIFIRPLTDLTATGC